MTRLSLLVVLMPSLLPAQLAEAPHFHGSDVHHHLPQGEQPHFHVRQILPFWHSDSAPTGDAHPLQLPAVRANPPSDHDADAVYLPETIAEALGRAKAGHPDATPWLFTPLFPALNFSRQEPTTRTAQLVDRVLSPRSCALFIQHLALLI
jgi:hypothetical protein